MNKDMLNYFKGENEFYEFVLLNVDGKNRMDLLGVTYSCYSSKETAKKWYESIRSNVSNKRAIKKLDTLYSDMIR
jgi:hypothetical protein